MRNQDPNQQPELIKQPSQQSKDPVLQNEPSIVDQNDLYGQNKIPKQ